MRPPSDLGIRNTGSLSSSATATRVGGMPLAAAGALFALLWLDGPTQAEAQVNWGPVEIRLDDASASSVGSPEVICLPQPLTVCNGICSCPRCVGGWSADDEGAPGTTVAQTAHLCADGGVDSQQSWSTDPPQYQNQKISLHASVDLSGSLRLGIGIEHYDDGSSDSKVSVIDTSTGDEIPNPFDFGFQFDPASVALSPQTFFLSHASTVDDSGAAVPSILGYFATYDLGAGLASSINTLSGGNVSNTDVIVLGLSFRGTISQRVAVVWESFGSPGDDDDLSSIQARLVNDDGTFVGPQFQVNTYTASFQSAPKVAAAPDDSGFLVVWDSDGSPGDDNSLRSVQAQLFDQDGQPVGSQVQVNQSTAGFQWQPAVGALADGRYVVIWTDDSTVGPVKITGRFLGADGIPVGDEFQINTGVVSSEPQPEIATYDNEFVAVWLGDGVRMRGTFGFLFADGFESGDVSSWSTSTP